MVCAGGSHECNGKSGTLTPSPITSSRASPREVPLGMVTVATVAMLLDPAWASSPRIPASIRLEPRAVKSTNRRAASRRAAGSWLSPKRWMSTHIGISTISKATKKTTRSPVQKVASAPVSTISRSPK